MSGAFSNLPSSQDTSPQLVEEKPAIIGGAVASVIALILAVIGVSKVLDAMNHFVWFSVAAYLVGMVIQFWVSSAWRDGLTVNELFRAALWPIDTFRSIRAGSNNVQLTADADTSPNVLEQQPALIAGAVASVIAFGLGIYGISQALAVVGALVWFVVVAFMIGMVVQFWFSQAWKDGFTVNELARTAIWPAGMFATIRKGVQKRRMANNI